MERIFGNQLRVGEDAENESHDQCVAGNVHVEIERRVRGHGGESGERADAEGKFVIARLLRRPQRVGRLAQGPQPARGVQREKDGHACRANQPVFGEQFEVVVVRVDGVGLKFGAAEKTAKIKVGARTGAKDRRLPKLIQRGLPVRHPDVPSESRGQPLPQFGMRGNDQPADAKQHRHRSHAENERAVEAVRLAEVAGAERQTGPDQQRKDRTQHTAAALRKQQPEVTAQRRVTGEYFHRRLPSAPPRDRERHDPGDFQKTGQMVRTNEQAARPRTNGRPHETK